MCEVKGGILVNMCRKMQTLRMLIDMLVMPGHGPMAARVQAQRDATTSASRRPLPSRPPTSGPSPPPYDPTQRLYARGFDQYHHLCRYPPPRPR